MKIDRLVLKNFTSHKDSDFTLDKLTVIRANNGNGKSSIVDALSLLLTGRSERTDDRGSGAKDLIRKGQDKALVGAQVTIDGGERSLRMSLTEKSGRTVTAKNGKEESPEIVEHLQAHKDVLSCLCNTHYFIDMTEAQQKDFLAGIVLPRTYQWDEQIKTEVFHAGIHVNWTGDPLGVISAVYVAAFADRREYKKRLKEFSIPEKPTGEAPDVDGIRSKLSERQKQRTAVALKRQEAQQEHDRDVRAREKLAARKRDLQAKVASWSQAVEQATTLSDKAIKGLQKTAAQADKARALDKKIDDFQAEQIANDRAVEKLESLGDIAVCPTCSQPITQELISQIGMPLVENRQRILASLRDAYEQRKQLGNYEEALKKLADNEQIIRDVELIKRNIAEAEKELETIPDGTGTVDLDLTAYDSELADLDNRIERGNRALYEAGRFGERCKAHDSAVAQQRQLEAKLESLERLIEYFGPDGIKAKLLNEHVGGFVKRMNAAMDKWHLYCELSFEPYAFTVQFRAADYDVGPAFNLRTLSKSQQYRFAVAFQLALAELTFGFCIIDGADILDGPTRQALFAALRESKLEQIIVLATDERRQVPKAEHTVFYAINSALDGGIPTSTMEML